MSGEAGAAQAMAAQKIVERMLNAVQKGNIAELKTAINTLGCKTPNAVHAVRDGMGRGLLHYAAQFGQEQMIKNLVSQMDFAVDDQDSAGETPLALAAATDKADSVKLLLSLGANPNKRKDDTSTAALHRAASGCSQASISDNSSLALLLSDERVDIDIASSTGTPLCWAAGAGNAGAVHYLLQRKADPNNRGTGGDDALPALSLAAGAGCVNSVKALLAAGANAKATGRGQATALHVAAAIPGREKAALEIAKALLEAGADANAQDAGGLTPVEAAAASGNLQLAGHLMSVMKPLDSIQPWDLKTLMQKTIEKLQQQEKEAAAAAGQNAVAVPEAEEPDADKAAACKRTGDEAFVGKRFHEAVEAYSQSLRHDSKNSIVWANRAAAHLRLDQAADALKDAQISRTLDPRYAKAWYREGCAFEQLKKWEDAASAFYEACGLIPGNAEFEAGFKRCIEAGREEHKRNQNK